MQDLSHLPRPGRVQRMLVAVLFSAIAAMMAMVISFGHPHVRAEAASVPNFGLMAPAWGESGAAAGRDASLPDAAEALRLVPTSAGEPASTF